MSKKPSFTEVNNLLDIYQSCLTSKQVKIMEMKYRLDLSLREISENLKISRSGILASINESLKKMESLEKKLKLISKREKIIKILDDKKINLKDMKKKIKGVL